MHQLQWIMSDASTVLISKRLKTETPYSGTVLYLQNSEKVSPVGLFRYYSQNKPKWTKIPITEAHTTNGKVQTKEDMTAYRLEVLTAIPDVNRLALAVASENEATITKAFELQAKRSRSLWPEETHARTANPMALETLKECGITPGILTRLQSAGVINKLFTPNNK